MSRLNIIFMSAVIACMAACTTIRLPENINSDYKTSGPLTDDVFQVIITASPDKTIKTHSEPRENALMLAKKNIRNECVNRMLQYYCERKQTTESQLTAEHLSSLKDELSDLADDAVIEENYYLPDNSSVLVVRVYSKNITNKILNY